MFIYEAINYLEISHSDVLRPLIIDYVKSLSNNAEKGRTPEVYQQSQTDEIRYYILVF